MKEKEFQYSGTLTQKSQVTVPKKIREALGITPLGKVSFLLRDSGKVEIQAAPSLLNLAGKYTNKIKRKNLSKLRDDMEELPYERP
jgi:AbrB family looped-hinge helix DNA binding protein